MQPSSRIAETVSSDTPATARQDFGALTPLLSDKDATAPGLAEAERLGLLPRQDSVEAYLRSLGA